MQQSVNQFINIVQLLLRIEEKGKFVEEIAPKFAEYIYNSRCRFVKSTSLNNEMYEEILKILDIAKDYDALILSDEEVNKVIGKVKKEECINQKKC